MFRRNTPPTPTAPTAGGISLTKGGTGHINMRKDTPGATITAHLEWDGGSASRRAKGADLELYVLYVPHSATAPPAAHALPGWAVYWNNLGGLDTPPYILHHGDSLTPGRETATIARPDQQRYALICAYSAVGNGVGSFKSYGARAVITDGQGQTVTVPLYDNNPHAYWVAIALADFTGDGVTIRQVERYSGPGSENRPALNPDGTFAMDRGPVEFKDR